MAANAAESMKVKIMESVEIPVLNRCCFCMPLRKGLIAMAYINLILTALILPFFTYFIFTYNDEEHYSRSFVRDEGHIMPQMVIEFIVLVIEFVMTIIFIVGLHLKKVVLMTSYLYFGIGYLLFSTVYNVVLTILSKETANEFLLVISQLLIHFYFLILVWSSVVKMTRDGTVKYTRSEDEV